jgi:hypothetical protein
VLHNGKGRGGGSKTEPLLHIECFPPLHIIVNHQEKQTNKKHQTNKQTKIRKKTNKKNKTNKQTHKQTK